ncbi:hypothetical protein EMIT0347P_110097 [Pseudomonas sp. IT-347P]
MAMAFAGNTKVASRALADTTEQIFEKLRITGFPVNSVGECRDGTTLWLAIRIYVPQVSFL